jgi:hypothetical protein
MGRATFWAIYFHKLIWSLWLQVIPKLTAPGEGAESLTDLAFYFVPGAGHDNQGPML